MKILLVLANNILLQLNHKYMTITFEHIKNVCYYGINRPTVSIHTTIFFLKDESIRIAMERLMMCRNR